MRGKLTVDDVLSNLELLRPMHGMSEAHESVLIAGLLDPLIVLERGVESEIERRRGLRPAVVEKPVRKVGHELEDFVATGGDDIDQNAKTRPRRCITDAVAQYAATPSDSSYFVPGLCGNR